MANLCMLWGFVRPLPCLLVLLAMGCNRSIVEPPPPEESGEAAWIVHPGLSGGAATKPLAGLP